MTLPFKQSVLHRHLQHSATDYAAHRRLIEQAVRARPKEQFWRDALAYIDNDKRYNKPPERAQLQ